MQALFPSCARASFKAMGAFDYATQSQHAYWRGSPRSQLRLRILGVRGQCGPGFARRHHHDRRKTTAAARSKIRWSYQGESVGVDGLVGPARRTAQGRSQRIAHHDR
jgi:hypothetical protein